MDQHIRLTMVVDGKENVMFNTNLGWSYKYCIVVDCVNLQDAKDSATKFLRTMEPVPFENIATEEDLVGEASGIIKELIQKVEEIESPLEFNVVYPMELTIKFEESYQVHFE